VRKGGAKAANPATNSPASISTELPRCGVSPQPHRSGSAAPADHGVPELRGRLGGVDTGGSCVRIVGRPAGIAGGCEVDPVAHVTGDAHDLVGCVGAGRATRRFTTVHGPVPQPFADMLINHTGSRPNLRAAGGMQARGRFPASSPAGTFAHK